MSYIDINKRYHCYRNICDGMMDYDFASGQFVCELCGAKAWPDELADNDAGIIDLNIGDTYNGVKGFSFAYDPDGEHFKCPECGGNVMNDEINDRQICSICGHVITEAEFNKMLKDWDEGIW